MSRIRIDDLPRDAAPSASDLAEVVGGADRTVTDAHDRYANLETSYLLRNIEPSATLITLTSNARD